MKSCFIDQIKPSMVVHSYFVISEKEIRSTRTGSPYVNLKLSDKTGFINGKIWENSNIDFSKVPDNGVVLVNGKASSFNDTLQLIIDSIEPVEFSSMDPVDFLPSSKHDSSVLLKELKKHVKPVYSSVYGSLVRCFFADQTLMKAFVKAPGAVSVHHAYIGGLLEHTLGVVRLINTVCGIYEGLDRDLLLTGALFHDIGKIREYTYDWRISYTDEGRLIGHTVLGVEIVNTLAQKARDFPEEKRMLVKHLILSHHGKTEFGAVKVPMTKEAMVLHMLDDLDARIASLDQLYKEHEGMGGWTSYISIYDRRFFISPSVGSYEETCVAEEASKQVKGQLHIKTILEKISATNTDDF